MVVLLAAACLVAGARLRAIRSRHSAAMAAVVAAADALPYRSMEARLSEELAYRPLQRLRRGGDDILDSRFLDATTQIGQQRDTPGGQRALAALELILGRSDAAVDTLEKLLFASTGTTDVAAALAAARDPALLNDTAAGYLSRASAETADTMIGAEAAERGWSIAQTSENAWNRALAREALHVRAPALVAWNDVLRLEKDAAWRNEAIGHVRWLSTPTRSHRWRSMRAVLERADDDSELIDSIVRSYPQEARVYVEEELLPAWAATGMNAPLRRARVIADALRRATNEGLPLDSIAAIERADDATRRCLMEAHAAYARGRALAGEQQMQAAASELALASRLFARSASPFAFRAAMYAASAKYSGGHLNEALTELDHVRDAVGPRADRYPSLFGQTEWVIGLIEFSRGRNNESLSAYRTALLAFERAQEMENTLGVVVLLAEVSRTIGQERAAWRYLEEELRTAEALGPTKRTHGVLSDAAEAAMKRGLPLAALVFQNELVSITRAANEPVSLCDALVARGGMAASAGDHRQSEADLTEVRQLLPKIADEGMRTRTLANLGAAETRVWRSLDPRRAVAAADAAMLELNRLGHRATLIDLQLEAGRAAAQIAQPGEALRRWRDAIDECERQRTALPVSEFRRTYFEQCRAIFDESIGTLARAGQFRQALTLAEESRARGLLDVLTRADAAFDAAAVLKQTVPTGVTIIEYMVLADAVVTWTIDTDNITGQVQSVTRAELRRRIDMLQTSDAAAQQQAASQLFDLLVRPVAPRLGARVVFVPDGDIYRIPFAALRDAAANRFLVQDHAVSVAPGLAVLAAREESRGSGAWTRLALIDAGAVDNPYREDAVRLPAAAAEIADIRALYANATVISGAACTPQTVKTALAHADAAHFTGHATPASSDAEPALVLRPGQNDRGLLYPADIAALDLRHMRLVVLGACGTADGRIGSEGPLSIARAFLAGGAERVVATLWPVDDDAAREVLTRFHVALRGNSAPAHALRQVQLQALQHSKPVRDWAAFEVIESGY